MSLSLRLGTDSELKFTCDFFAWLRRQMIVIEDSPYVEVDFRGSMDLVLPYGMDWDVSGMKSNTLSSVFYFLKFILFLCVLRGDFNRCIISPCR
jgi:hypothetical protein